MVLGWIGYSCSCNSFRFEVSNLTFYRSTWCWRPSFPSSQYLLWPPQSAFVNASGPLLTFLLRIIWSWNPMTKSRQTSRAAGYWTSWRRRRRKTRRSSGGRCPSHQTTTDSRPTKMMSLICPPVSPFWPPSSPTPTTTRETGKDRISVKMSSKRMEKFSPK